MSVWFELCNRVEGDQVNECVCVCVWKREWVYQDIKVDPCVYSCVCVHVHPFPGVLSSSRLLFMKGEVQREQQMSKRWPLWWQKLGLELKGTPPPNPQSSSPMSTHTPKHTQTHHYLPITDGWVNDEDDTSYLILASPQYPAASKAFQYPPKAVKIFKVCSACGG